MGVVYLETVVFFYDFHGFSGIRSTQPTALKTPKLTPMVRFCGVLTQMPAFLTAPDCHKKLPN